MDWIDEVLNEGEKELGEGHTVTVQYLDSRHSEVKEQLMREEEDKLKEEQEEME